MSEDTNDISVAELVEARIAGMQATVEQLTVVAADVSKPATLGWGTKECDGCIDAMIAEQFIGACRATIDLCALQSCDEPVPASSSMAALDLWLVADESMLTYGIAHRKLSEVVRRARWQSHFVLSDAAALAVRLGVDPQPFDRYRLERSVEALAGAISASRILERAVSLSEQMTQESGTEQGRPIADARLAPARQAESVCPSDLGLTASAPSWQAAGNLGTQNRVPGGTLTDWKVVQGRLLAKRERGEPYTSGRSLAIELGCKEPMIRKAIKNSDSLKGWKSRSTGPKAAPKARGLDAAVRDNTRQTTELSPVDSVSDDPVDTIMAHLVRQSSPCDRSELKNISALERRTRAVAFSDETVAKLILDAKPLDRASLKAMDEPHRLSLVATMIEQRLDSEPSPLESDKPGERPREVKQLKRL